VIYDPIKTALAALRSHVTDVPVSSDLVGHKTGSLRLRVSLTGMTPQIRRRLDRVTFDIDAYGPSKDAAVALAMDARSFLLYSTPATSWGGVGIADAEETLGPQDLDDTVSREHRIVFSVALYMFVRS
jgi:hypothetical protein